MSQPAGTIVEGGGMEERTQSASRQRMVAWLLSDDARAAARSDLHRLGLDVLDADDLLHDVAVSLLRVALPAELDNPVGYARRALSRRATDLLRGELVRRAHDLPLLQTDDEAPLTELVDAADLSPADAAVLATLEDGIRRALQVALAEAKAWTVSAALSTLTLAVHREVALPSGAPETDRWAALWLAGERDVFPDGDARPDDAARRQARSRKLRVVDDLLRRIAVAVLGADDDA
jgi:hypothetical protein